jgi:hypothetical protein
MPACVWRESGIRFSAFNEADPPQFPHGYWRALGVAERHCRSTEGVNVTCDGLA